MLVTRSDLEASLGRARAAAAGSAEGIHGPGSTAWQLQRESLCFLGGGRAALLQLAHPYVAYGVDEHSRTRTDPQGRFRRTFAQVFAMTFGDLERAFKAARRVHAIHTRITGTLPEALGAFPAGHRYAANESSALLWVYATLIDTVIYVHELVLRPLPVDVKERYYQDSKQFARLFGVPEDELPADYPAFAAYVARMVESSVLTVSAPAREIGGFLFQPPARILAPAVRLYRTVTAALLPPRIRRGYGFELSRWDRARFRAFVTGLRPAYRALPREARYLPAYVEARRRLAGKEPSPVATMVDRLVFQVG